MLRVAFCLLFALIGCPALGSSITDPTRAIDEVVDLELVDNGYTLGLVTAQLDGNTACIFSKDLFNLLGLAADQTTYPCITAATLNHDFGISIEIDLRKMRASIEHGSTYPAKAYAEASRRMQSLAPSQAPPSKTITYRARMMPELRHLSASIHRHTPSGTNPDLQAVARGTFLGGNVHLGGNLVEHRATKQYSLTHQNANLRYVLSTPYNIIQSVDFGTSLHDRDARILLNGLRVSNIPLSRRESVVNRRFTIQAPPGSIVEWMPETSQHLSGLVGADGQFEASVPLGYGLNHFQYWITQPDQLTDKNWLWQKIPSRLVPTKTVEYELMYGRQPHFVSNQASLVSLRYGMTNWLSLGTNAVYRTQLGKIERHAQIEVIAVPTPAIDLLWSLNSASKHRFQVTYWRPSGISVDVGSSPSDNIRQTAIHRTERHHYSRFSWHTSHTGRFNIRLDQFRHIRGNHSFAEAGWTHNVKKSTFSASFVHSQHQPKGYQPTSQSHLRVGTVNRLGRRVLLSPDINMIVRPSILLESVRVNVHFNTNAFQLGLNTFHLPTFKQSGLGASIRIHTDMFVLTNRNDLRSNTLYSHQSFQTSWSKSAPGVWHPNSQSGPLSSGIQLIPFFDANGNSKHDPGETTLSGLRGHTREARAYRRDPNASSLIFTELQPHRRYQVVLDKHLSNHHDYVVSTKVWHIESPGSGILTVYIPVSKSIEADGTWILDELTVFNPSAARLVFSSLISNEQYEGTLFGDGSWYIDAIPTGVFNVQVRTGDGKTMQTSPEFIAIDGSVNPTRITILTATARNRS